MTRVLLAGLLALSTMAAQQAQNPSPMVEHTRAHTRLAEQTPPGGACRSRSALCSFPRA